jgi:penicillin-binding protein 2
MSLAGLQEGVAQEMHVYCNGGATFYGHFYACDRHHGMVDIEHAIPWSCDTFFYTLANRLGIDTIARYAKSVGLGQRTGIDLPNEAAGTMPSEQWKLRNYHEKWFAGETISVGIGQGAVTATPIQLARMIAGIASDGHFVRPHVVDPAQLPAPFRQAIKDSFPGSGEATVPLDPANWMTITDGMAGATDPTMGGTAGASHLEGVDFAGKTGSAQVASHEAIQRLGGGKQFLPNGWFVGVIPRRNPEFVVAVLWEHGDWGSNAARLAAQVATVYVNKKRMQDHNVMARTGAPSDGSLSLGWKAGAPSDGSLSLGWKAGSSKPIEMGAVWSESESRPEPAGRNRRGGAGQTAVLLGGHFLLAPAPPAPARVLAANTRLPLPKRLLAARSVSLPGFREGKP